jgi:hypothetical protein
MATDRANEPKHQTDHEESSNVVAWAGIAFGLVAAILYGILFYLLSELPSSRNELEELRSNAPVLTRLLFAVASAGLMNFVSLMLCLTGYILPGRSRFAAVVGVLFSGLMFLAVFSVVIISLV